MLLQMKVRDALRRLAGGGDVEFGASQEGALHVVQMGFRKSELARAGALYGASSATGTAKAPVTAVPTLTADWGIYNGDPKKEYHVDSIFAWSVSGTLGLGLSLWACVSVADETAVSAQYTNSQMQSLSGRGKGTKAVFTSAVTLLLTPVWVPVQARDQVSAISVGSGLVADNIEGKFVVPPRHVLGLTVIAPVGTTALFGAGATWAAL